MSLLLALLLLIPNGVYSGIASWYADPKAPQGSFYGAVPGYRGHPFYVTVRKGKRHIRVRVADSCGCPGGRVIDLSWNAFVHLGVPLSRGLTTVIIER